MSLLSLTGKRWLLPDLAGDAASDVIGTLLMRRGIDALGEGEILETFGHDARHFRDFEKAAERITRAITSKENIGIFGDYDCDGITSTALLARFLKRRGIQPAMRLPHRLKEGYGLQNTNVEEFRSVGTTLLFTVDTGVTALEPVAHSHASGMDVIVLDHHHLPPELPTAHAILHPSLTTQPMDPAPCGAGVTWSFVNALEGDNEWEDRATDIALGAIGTVADVVELRGGNRTLTHAGLLALSQLKNGPLALLCMHAGLEMPYSSRDVAFRIAPRINAAGRMADPHIALHALLGDTASLLSLDALNNERRDVVSGHLEDLLPTAEEHAGMMLCFLHDDYTPGICGLLAGKLCEAFGKPVLVGARRDGICSASLRSIPAFNVTTALARASDLLLSFGGHAMAAGCTFREDAFDALRERLDADVRGSVPPEHLKPAIGADAVIAADDVTLNLCNGLQTVEPFGQGNPEPRFVIQSVRLERARRVGAEGKHLQATVQGRKLIGFNLGHLEEQTFAPVDLLCRVGLDTWNGRRQPQLFLDDMRIAEKAHYSRDTSSSKLSFRA